jgi:glutathione S-transferase
LWRISRHTALYPKEKRLPGEVALARQDFQDMAAVMEKHMTGRRFIEGDRVTVADFVAAYTLDWANEVHLLDASPQLRRYMDEMYTRPRAPLRIAAALASVPGRRVCEVRCAGPPRHARSATSTAGVGSRLWRARWYASCKRCDQPRGHQRPGKRG